MAAGNDTRMDGKSLDITKENIAAMKEFFPEVVAEGKIDFDKLKLILGEEVDSNDERYNFTWYGKNQAIRMSQTPSMGTLRPCKEESVDWDTTQNLYIEGDNLEVLKLLQKSYFGKIKMIYIDPPYNTGNDFVYSDNYEDSIGRYKAITNQIDAYGKTISVNNETDGRYHTNWLNMLYPRLKLARNLLSSDGAIFISLDENEIANLEKISNEIFGENNRVGKIKILSNPRGRQSSKFFAECGEYVMIYAKNINLLTICGDDISDEAKATYSRMDAIGQYREMGLRKRGSDSRRVDSPTMFFPIYYNEQTSQISTKDDGHSISIIPKLEDGTEGRWRWSKTKVDTDYRTLYCRKVKRDGFYEYDVFEKCYLTDDLKTKFKDYWIEKEINYDRSSDEIRSVFTEKIFDYAKPLYLIRKIMKTMNLSDGEIILDFFSGSATTANAVLLNNIENKKSISFILVQLPEMLSNPLAILDFDAKSICDIGKERIRRAGKKIRKIQSQTTIDGQRNNVDVGFKVFKLDSSNVKIWNPSGDVKHTLLDYENNIVSDSGRTNLDIVYEIMLKMGLELTSKIDVIDDGGATLYSISSGALMICLDDIKDTIVAEKMISIYKEQKPFVWKVVFKDNGFASDDVKANTRETLKMAGLPEGSFVTL